MLVLWENEGITVSEISARMLTDPGSLTPLLKRLEGEGLLQRQRSSLPGLDRDAAQSLVDRAHIVCPYSNATRGNIDVTLTIV